MSVNYEVGDFVVSIWIIEHILWGTHMQSSLESSNPLKAIQEVRSSVGGRAPIS